VIKRECEKNNVAYFNITKISRNAQNDLTLLAGDGLHPSKIMYKQWVEIIKPYFNNY
jgi:lysophospholipase L1-like esterase